MAVRVVLRRHPIQNGLELVKGDGVAVSSRCCLNHLVGVIRAHVHVRHRLHHRPDLPARRVSVSIGTFVLEKHVDLFVVDLPGPERLLALHVKHLGGGGGGRSREKHVM